LSDETCVFYRNFDELEDRLDENYNHPKYDELKVLEKTKFDLIPFGDKTIIKKITSGTTPKGIKYVDVGIPFLGASSLLEDGIDIESSPKIENDFHTGKLNSSKITNECLLISMAGIIGRCKLYKFDFESNANQAVAILWIDEKTILLEYLEKYLNSRIGQLFFGKLQHISSQPNINLEEIQKIGIILPEPTYQQKIIDQLTPIESDVQQSIIKLKSSIRERDSILFNELGINIPNETGTSFFCDELDSDERMSWGTHHPDNKTLENALNNANYEPKPLSHFVTLSDDSINTWKVEPDKIFTYIGLENIESGTGKLLDVNEKIGKDIVSKSKIFKKGELMFGGLRPYLNKIFILDDYETAIGSAELFVCNPKDDVNIELSLLKYYLLSEVTLRQTKWILSGSSYPRLDDNDFLKLKIVLPEDEDEQTNILKKINTHETKFKKIIEDIDDGKNKIKSTFENMLSIPV